MTIRSQIVPVILAGGSGTRLWPLSKKSSPKQFLKLIGNNSLFQEALLRVQQIPTASEILVVINESHYFICRDQIKEVGIENVTMILEPCSRNTAPAIALAAHHVEPDAMMVILPADHLIGDGPGFSSIISAAAERENNDHLITFGIVPTSPKTGYGYIKSAEKLDEMAFMVDGFIEKPDERRAQSFLAAKNYYWNSGIFLFKAKAFLEELEKWATPIYQASLDAYHASEIKDDFLRIDEERFAKCPSNSIDYAVMEKTDKGAVIPFNLPWSDLGCWASVADAVDSDEEGNVIQGNVILKDCERCYLSSENKQLIATIGVKDLIVVATADAVLIADKAHAQEVKEIVKSLKKHTSQTNPNSFSG